MIALQRIEVAGYRFVLILEEEYERLCARAGETVLLNDDPDLPPLPPRDKQGRFPAVEYARVSLARDIIRARRAARLTQKELADLAGTHRAVISRIETAGGTTSHKLVERIERGLERARKKFRKK